MNEPVTKPSGVNTQETWRGQRGNVAPTPRYEDRNEAKNMEMSQIFQYLMEHSKSLDLLAQQSAEHSKKLELSLQLNHQNGTNMAHVMSRLGVNDQKLDRV